MIHTLPLGLQNLHGHFSRDLAPILTIVSGDSVRFSVPNSGWLVESGEKLTPRDPAIDTGHALVGPIAVRGARAGQTLAVQVDEVRPGSWGITKTKPPHFIRWAINGNTATSLGRTVRLAPFLGVLGMTPPEPGIHSTIPPRRFGGTSTAKISWRAPRSICRSRSMARGSQPATVTPRRAMARCRARRSKRRSRRSSR